MNTKKHIVLKYVQKSIFVERELKLKIAKRVLLSKLEEVIEIGDQATILFEVKPLPLEIADQFYWEKLKGLREEGYAVEADSVSRKKCLEQFNKNCFVLLCHVFVEDIRDEIQKIPEYSECLPYEE